MELKPYDAYKLLSQQSHSPKSLSIQIPRSFAELGSINLDSDTSQSPDEDVRDRYVLSKKATVRENGTQKKNFLIQLSRTSSLGTQKVHEIPEQQDCDYLYSLYPGLRTCVWPDSVTAIICRHAGIFPPRALQNAANVWSRAPADTHEIHVALLKKNFGLILPAEAKSGNTSNLTQEARSTTPADAVEGFKSPSTKHFTENDGLRSDFEASAFMAFMPSRAFPIIQKANPEDLAGRMLPAGLMPSGARFVAACFWSFLCIIDDLTEDGECSDCIDTAITSLTSFTSLAQLTQNICNIWSRKTPENSTLKDCKMVITAFHHAVVTTVLYPSCPEKEDWKLSFWHEVGTVVRALQDEKPLHGRKFSMEEWIRLRILTISARPFMVLARASLGLPTDLNDITTSPRINQMQILVQSITGLQNDLLGWQKDHVEKNPMCVVEIMIRDGIPQVEAFEATLLAHNDVVRALLNFAELPSENPDVEGWAAYVRILVGFCHAMARWMLESKRYRVLEERMRAVVSNPVLYNPVIYESVVGHETEFQTPRSHSDMPTTLGGFLVAAE